MMEVFAKREASVGGTTRTRRSSRQTVFLTDRFDVEKGLHLTRFPKCSASIDATMSPAALISRRPYLAIDCVTKHDTVEEFLINEMQSHTILCTSNKLVVMFAVLDGAPEYSREQLRLCEIKHTDELSDKIESKDSLFCESCHKQITRFRGVILDGSGEARSYDSSERRFQDGHSSAFVGEDALHRAIAASFHIRSRFKRHNEDRNVTWTEQLHARIAIGLTWKSALACLRLAWRDDIIVSIEALRVMHPMDVEVMLEGGIRVGPSDHESYVEMQCRLAETTDVYSYI